MNQSILEWSKFFANLATIAGLSALFFHYMTYRKHRFDIIHSLGNRYNALMEELAKANQIYSQSGNESIKIYVFRNYFILCEEELYFIKHRYIQKKIAETWIDAMLHLLPVFTYDLKTNTFLVNADKESLTRYIDNLTALTQEMNEILDRCPIVKEIFFIKKAKNRSQVIEYLNVIK